MITIRNNELQISLSFQKIADTTVNKLDDDGIDEAEEALPDQLDCVNLLDMGDDENTHQYQPLPTTGDDLIDIC